MTARSRELLGLTHVTREAVRQRLGSHGDPTVEETASGGQGETTSPAEPEWVRHAGPVQLELPRGPASVEAFEVRSLEVSEPSSSMYGRSAGKGSYPVPAQASQYYRRPDVA